ncbi:MAG: hypothetical protein WD733_01720 [Bryobacterales bacterium]
MSDFASTTPFQLVRRLAAAGQNSPSAYFLIAATSATESVQVDLAAEVEVQIGGYLQCLAAADLDPERLEHAFGSEIHWPNLLITVDHWVPNVIDWFDRNVVIVIGAGAVLFLANPRVAERVLRAAPNLRNRLTDILTIEPDPAFGGFLA